MCESKSMSAATWSRCRSRSSSRGPSGPYAFIVGKDRTVQKRMIKVGVTNKTTAVIDSGLEAGETVVTDGQYRIQAGSRVEFVGDRDNAPTEKSAGGF